MKLFKSAFGKKEQDNNQEKLKQSNGTFTIDEQFMTPEFLYKPSQDGTKRLSKQFFLSLSTIENTFNLQQVKSHSLVEELVAMYQECVQVYDGLLDPIKYYFVDKIKNILNQTDKFQGRNHSASQHVQSVSTNNLPRATLNDQKPFSENLKILQIEVKSQLNLLHLGMKKRSTRIIQINMKKLKED